MVPRSIRMMERRGPSLAIRASARKAFSSAICLRRMMDWSVCASSDVVGGEKLPLKIHHLILSAQHIQTKTKTHENLLWKRVVAVSGMAVTMYPRSQRWVLTASMQVVLPPQGPPVMRTRRGAAAMPVCCLPIAVS